mmetsp:Transcript_23159/g.50142  ORF Transcript_23159/g.50142 Transcript_23159/m.50142 type:complete len:768 (-) Transcript_23159:83-2386(-)|eukprot:CAMPEP_0172305234 /NCGR_PEP_ID=MMETSP1058-20130122/6556_1 /TAXON_ID=83371 /ORGANISM="Detonula confervacea, Strain CCMP 353" /LENGTH=767 /DNA_ID=CAMNT_0013016765 /DNA_START=279 /DNA_END=2582 /DNA_ORIENTATION=-
MSRRRGEFEHRTSIFEGAFRAWSHLGGVAPLDLENKPPADLDPLNFPLLNDPRLAAQKGKGKKNDNDGGGVGGGDDFNDGGGGGPSADAIVKNKGSRRDYPYEPLPRSGLAHPFVQAILSPWLGPDADQDAIQLGLTTLRTWWQHRRKGESGSAVVALGTDKMRGVVEGYTRHFFNLAHCLVANDKEQPPRTLHGKMRDLEKSRNKKGKKRSREDESIKAAAMAFQSGFGPGLSAGQQQSNDPMMGQLGGGNNMMGGGMNTDALNNISPLERLQAAQRRQLAGSGGVHTSLGGEGMGMPDPAAANTQPIEMKGRCIPGKVDLPGLVQQVSSAATQLAHRGISASSSGATSKMSQMNNVDPSKYGDPNVTPIVVVSTNQHTGKKDIQFCMTIDGITCAHCVKIVETVLRGCHGSRSPVDGLIDAAADMELNMVLIKIDNIGECRRIAHEASRNLSMVGYTAKAKSVTVSSDLTLRDVYGVLEGTIPNVAPMGGFQWNYGCGCPDNNVMRQGCPRHSQMGGGIIEVFDKTEQLLSQFVAGCTKRTGMPCTAGVHCFCQSGANGVAAASSAKHQPQQQVQSADLHQENNNTVQQQDANNNGYKSYQQPIQDSAPTGAGGEVNDNSGGVPHQRRGRTSMRMSALGGRMSIGGLGGLGRHFSLTSETQFGRAMSGLSALSIDWENMDDFDVNVDHSAGINNDIINGQQQAQAAQGGGNGGQEGGSQDNGTGGYGQQQPQAGGVHMAGPRAARRSSLRKNINVGTAFNVSFNM